MKYSQRLLICASLFAALLMLTPAPADAGGHFGLHFGGAGFGVSVGVGDWGVYTNAWSNPQWSPNFNAALAGYGEWVSIDGLGRCWRPWVAPGWRPYTYGRWAHTGASLTWIAYEPWGYFPHHYGSWANASYGWVWVPGYTYVSANVTWVRGGAYVGWYARPPLGWSHSSRAFHHAYKRGYREGWNDARYGTYVDWKHFASDNVSRHAVSHTVASKTRLSHGGAVPSNDELWRNGRSKLGASRVSTRTVRMDGREVTLVRPEVGAASIERNARGTVRNALSEPAHRQRQPQATTRRSIAQRSVLAPTVDSTSQRSRASDSRVRSSYSTGRGTQSKGSFSRPESGARPSQSISRSATDGAKQATSQRRGYIPRVSTNARTARSVHTALPNEHTRSTTVSRSDNKRSPNGSSGGSRSTVQIRRPQTRAQSKKIGTGQRSADSSKDRTRRRATARQHQ